VTVVAATAAEREQRLAVRAAAAGVIKEEGLAALTRYVLI
jgi:hypothetical protein